MMRLLLFGVGAAAAVGDWLEDRMNNECNNHMIPSAAEDSRMMRARALPEQCLEQ